MVNTRATNYENEVDEKVITSDSENGDETECSVSDKDSDYIPSDNESLDSCENTFTEYQAAQVLVNLKQSSNWSNKRKRSDSDSDSDSDYVPENASDSDEEYIGINHLRGMPKPSGVHIRFD